MTSAFRKPNFASHLSALASFRRENRGKTGQRPLVRCLSVEPLEARRVLSITLEPLGTYSTGIFDESAAEIAAHDPDSQQLFVTNTFVDGTAGKGGVDVLDISDPANPALLFTIDTTLYGIEPTSVAVSGGTVAVAVRNEEGGPAGNVAFFDIDGNPLNVVQVGFGPDMLTFTPDGAKVLVANQGRPSNDYEVDPEGSVSILDISGGAASATVLTASFTKFNGHEDELRDKGVRIFGPVVEDGQIVGQAPAANDLEPENIAVSEDSSTAWVTLQENNAVAILDIASADFVDIKGLGYKNHRANGNGLDASDRDGGINIDRWRVKGMYQPDGIAAYAAGNDLFLVTANEGASRDTDAFNEEARLKDVNVVRGLQGLQDDDKLGRLQITTEPPHGKHIDKDGELVLNQLYTFGTRSFSIWNEDVELVFDSGDDLERITAAQFPEHFNANDANEFDADGLPDNLDNRSDNKGPEPETVVVGEVGGRSYAFVGMERMGGIMIYDVTNPQTPIFQSYVNRRDFTEPNTIDVDGNETTNPAVGDLAVEGLVFISAADSPSGKPLLVAANEVSGTTTIFEVRTEGFKALRIPLGDVNRDGTFDRSDIIQVLQSGKYLSDESAVWSEGDWNRDGVFDQLDIILALRTGTYAPGPLNATDALFTYASREHSETGVGGLTQGVDSPHEADLEDCLSDMLC